MFGTIIMATFIFIGVCILLAGFFTVKQETAAVIERLGKFHSVRHAGLHLKIPIIDNIAKRLNLKIQQLDVVVDTKTLDNVFITMRVSVQYQVIRNQVADAYYRLEDPHSQITSYVFDVVRAEVPKLKLDDVFEQVKQAMNRINAAEREKTAAEYESEAQRIRIVAVAKAEAESKKLQGQGIADQRREIAKGLEESVKMLNNVNIKAQEASALIVVTQHYDTLHSIGANNRSNLILLPNSPMAANTMLNDLVTAMTAAHKIQEDSENQE